MLNVPRDSLFVRVAKMGPDTSEVHAPQIIRVNGKKLRVVDTKGNWPVRGKK